MARTALVPQIFAQEGITPSFSAADALGHSIPGNVSTVVHVKNGSAAPINVTVLTPAMVSGLAVAEQIVAVPAAGEKIIGPFSKGTYSQPDGSVYIDFSAVTTVTVACYRW